MSSQSLNSEFESAYEIYTDKLQKPLEVVACLRCGRPLTNEKSRLACIGPKCARKLAYEARTRLYSSKTVRSYQSLLKSSTQETVIPTKDIALYYTSNSSTKPYCKIGSVLLPTTDSCTTNEYHYRKRTYTLPLLEGAIYEVGVSMPEVRVFVLQVKDHQLRDISNALQ